MRAVRLQRRVHFRIRRRGECVLDGAFLRLSPHRDKVTALGKPVAVDLLHNLLHTAKADEPGSPLGR